MPACVAEWLRVCTPFRSLVTITDPPAATDLRYDILSSVGRCLHEFEPHRKQTERFFCSRGFSKAFRIEKGGVTRSF